MKRKAIFFSVLIVIIVIVVTAIHTYYEAENNKIILNMQAQNQEMPVQCNFKIGQSAENVEEVLEDANVFYTYTKNRDGVKSILVEENGRRYWFIIGSENTLIRIDCDDYNGVGVVLPKNFQY